MVDYAKEKQHRFAEAQTLLIFKLFDVANLTVI